MMARRRWIGAVDALVVFGLAAALSLVCSQASALTTTTTALTSSVNPAALAQSTTLKATVTPSSATGTVTFKDGTTTLGTGTLASGTASYSATFSTTGTHNLTAVYGGTTTYATSTSSAVSETVTKKSTTAVLTSSVNPATIGQSTTLKATVTPTGATGAVTFMDGAATLGTGTLSSGVATYAATFSAAGSHSLTAVYGGDSSDAASTSSALTQTIKTKTTTTALASSVNPSQLGQVTTLTATLTPSTATGTVTFKDGTTTLGTGTLSSGVATYAATFSTTGSHSLTAVYGGDSSDATSTSSALTQAVNTKTSTTALASSVNPSQLGQVTTLKATVTPSTATGTVTFKNGTTTLGTGTLSSGVATYAATFSTTGSHSLTAVYGGDSSDATSTSSALTQAVNTKTSTTALASSVNPSQLGQATTLKATVTPSTATGTVTFKDGTTTLGTGTLSSGAASYSATFNTMGSHSLTAIYGGDSSDATSTSSALTQTVNAKTTSTTLVSSVNPNGISSSITLKATVIPSTATGTVTFNDGTETLGTGTLSSGVATYATTFDTTGNHNLTAVYAGDTNDSISTSNVLIQTVGLNTSTIVMNSSTVLAGTTTRLDATVTPPASATGVVTFKDGTTTLGSANVVYGDAWISVVFAAAGSHSLTAIYPGDANNSPSTSSAVIENVVASQTSTTLVSSPNPTSLGASVTLAANVNSLAVGSPAATGTVTFMDGTTALGVGTLNSGVATLVTSFNTGGSHSLTAVYGGDPGHTASTSSAQALGVATIPSAVTLTTSINPAAAGGQFRFTATVTPSSATGTVTFMDGTTPLYTPSNIGAGVGELITALPTGKHSLTAIYSGDANYVSSTSSVFVETVIGAPTTTSLTSSLNPLPIGQGTTLTATVTSSSATGTVTFMDGTTTLGVGTLNSSGVATYAATFSAGGLHVLTAVYSGDGLNATSTSSALTQTINFASTTTALATSFNPATAGQHTTLTATVAPANATGIVIFKDGATTLGTGPLSSGVATYAATFSAPGSHTLTAVYDGDSSDAASTSPPLTQTVNSTGPPNSTTMLVPSANPTVAGNSLTLTATVTGNAPTGTVQFSDGGANLGSIVPLVNGQASYTLTPSSATGHLYGATYSGDTTNVSSTGKVAVNVTGVTSTTTLSSSTVSATPATSVTLTATVAGSSPTGSVVFRDGATVLQTSTVAGGVATWSQTFAIGAHLVTAGYAGDTTNSANVSTGVLIQISADGSVQPASAALQTNYEYDADGNLTKITDANAAINQRAYDSLSRATQITQPVPAPGQPAPTIGLSYDLRDQPATVTDPRNLSTSYTIDGLGNASAQTSPDTGGTTSTFYDSGLLKTSTDARGKTTTYTYDLLDRVTSVILSDGGTGITYNYDDGVNGVGHLTSVTDESGSTFFTYDGFGRIATKTQTSGPVGGQNTFAIIYAWGKSGAATGNLQSVKYPSGAQVIYGYDTAGRVNNISVIGADGVVTNVLGGLVYTAPGQPGGWVWGDGTIYQRAFDGYGRLVSYPLGNPNGAGISAGVMRTLAFDAAGRIVGYSHSIPINWDQVFAYDGLDRLTAANLTGGNTYGYAYDATGNRTQTTINGTSYTSTVSTTSNWYTNVATAAGGATSQGYDAAGNLTSDANGAYTYSGRGRLQSALRSGSTFSYLYNAFGQRVYKAGPAAVVTSGAANYVYDEAGHLVGEYDSTGKAIYETVYLGDMPVAALTQPAIGQTNVSFIYADHLNTARVIVRAVDQSIVWSWGANEPFGQTQANSNPNSLGTFIYNPRFPGQVADTESGWFYNWHRDYNPALGRYVQSDPIGLTGGSMSTYSYVNSNPNSIYDATGESPPLVSIGMFLYKIYKIKQEADEAGCEINNAYQDNKRFQDLLSRVSDLTPSEQKELQALQSGRAISTIQAAQTTLALGVNVAGEVVETGSKQLAKQSGISSETIHAAEGAIQASKAAVKNSAECVCR